MAKKTAQPFVHTNEEYEKLKKGPKPSERDARSQPRETPEGQAAGTRGYRKPRYAEWTLEELQTTAERLGVPGASSMTRDQLIDDLSSRDATQGRSGPTW